MGIPANLLYSKTHEWVEKMDSGNARVGLTFHAQELLSDLVFANICDIGQTLEAGGVIGDVESIKAVSEVFSPVSGRVEAVNQAVIDDPSLINSDPYGSWLVELSGVGATDALLSPEAYEQLLASEA